MLVPTIGTRSRSLLALVAVGALVLAACATTGTGDPDPTPTTGNLAVVVSGLPSGTSADVAISGADDVERTVTASATLSDLEPGTYTAIAADVLVGSDVYGASVSGSPAFVTTASTATIAVTYALLEPVVIGTLQVAIAGLPAGADADVRVSGPGIDTVVTSSETFVGIAAGPYAVTAASVTYEGIVYTASVSGSPAAVLADGVATVRVDYAAASTEPGSLTVTIAGLPEAVAADVTVSGAGAFEQTVNATTTFGDLEPGTYTASAADVAVGTDLYAASISGSPTTVPAGGAATIAVTYTLLDPTTVGTLQVDIEGLPEGVDADVEVAGVGSSQTLVASGTLAGLAPGNYTVTAADIEVDGLTYGGIVSLSPALVLPEETTTVTVAYQGVAFADGDAASNPGLHAQFRKTAGPPVWIDRMLFNASSPIDTKGIELRNDVSNPGDPADYLAFRLVHGEAPTTRVTMTLACGFEADVGSVIRAELRDGGGNKIGGTLICGSTNSYAIPNVGGAGNYLVTIGTGSNNPFYTDYVLSINAYCFQACNYSPYEE